MEIIHTVKLLKDKVIPLTLCVNVLNNDNYKQLFLMYVLKFHL